MTSPQAQHADEMASRYLGQFIELEEAGKGQTKKAQALYRKADLWLAKLLKLQGDA